MGIYVGEYEMAEKTWQVAPLVVSGPFRRSVGSCRRLQTYAPSSLVLDRVSLSIIALLGGR